MKSSQIIFTSAAAFLAGVVMMAMYKSLSSAGFVMVGGIVFLAVGLLNIIIVGRERNRSTVAALIDRITAAVAVIMGAAMLIFGETFVPLIGFIFSLIAVFGSLYQLNIIIYMQRRKMSSYWLYVFPGLLMAVAAAIYMQETTVDDPVIMMASGVGLVVFGIGGFIEAAIIVKNNKAAKALQKLADAKTETPRPLDGKNGA